MNCTILISLSYRRSWRESPGTSFTLTFFEILPPPEVGDVDQGPQGFFISLTLKQVWGGQSWEENQEFARMPQLLSDWRLLAEKLDSRELRGYGNQWVRSIIQSTFSAITMYQPCACTGNSIVKESGTVLALLKLIVFQGREKQTYTYTKSD